MFAEGGWVYTFSKSPYLRVKKANGDWLRLIDRSPNHISLSYYSLADLCKTNRMYTNLVGTYKMYNETKSRYEWYSGDVYVTDEFKNEIVWNFLGRMCHLLEDMSVPAHAHRDEHGLLDDRYETWVGSNNNYKVWNYQNVGNYLNPYYYNSSNPLHSLMYLTQQTADHFGSTGPHEKLGNDVIGGNYSSGEHSFLSGGYLTALGEPTGVVDIATPTSELRNIRDKTIPLVMRATAGLLYWFAKEADLLPQDTRYIQFYSPQFNTTPIADRNVDIKAAATPSDTYKYYLINGIEKDYNIKYYYAKGSSITVEAKNYIASGGYEYYFSNWSDGSTTR